MSLVEGAPRPRPRGAAARNVVDLEIDNALRTGEARAIVVLLMIALRSVRVASLIGFICSESSYATA